MSVRRSVDVGRLAAAVSRPGIDPRMWVELAVVTDVYVDAQENVFADVVFISDGSEDTCMLGALYAGPGFGAYFPVEINDTVLVAIPHGDPQYGPVIVSRMWSKADYPPREAESSDGNGAPSGDVVLRTKPGQRLKIRTSEDGDGVSIIVEGNGDIILTPEGIGKVYLGDDTGTEPGAKGRTLKQYLDADRAWKAAHTHGGVTTGGGATTRPVAPPPSVPDVEAAKVEVK